MRYSFVNFHSATPDRVAECTICSEVFGREKVVAHTSSGVTHCFHKKCLKEWVNARRFEAKCPLCNQDIRIQEKTKLTDRITQVCGAVTTVPTHMGFMGLYHVRVDANVRR